MWFDDGHTSVVAQIFMSSVAFGYDRCQMGIESIERIERDLDTCTQAHTHEAIVARRRMCPTSGR